MLYFRYNKEGRKTMRKVEFINRMILFGHIKEVERDFYMNKDTQELLKMYLMVVNTKIGERHGKEEKE